MDYIARLAVFAIVIRSQCRAKDNECSNVTNLDTRDRSFWYRSYTDTKCDYGLHEGWYRFSDRAGTEMATSCAAMHHCGTQYPGWLLGSHPATTDGRVNKTVCFTNQNNCCYWSTNITVRNCSGFYVYELKKLPNMCPYRFCGHEAVDCRDATGNLYKQGQVFNANKLQKCICGPNNNITCTNVASGCWDSDGIARTFQDVWLLKDGRTVCRCSSAGLLCTTHSVPVCFDDKKIVREQGSTWFMTNCTNCTCEERKVVCTQHDIKAFYGRTVVKRQTCYLEEKPTCIARNETYKNRKDCKVYFTNVNKYFWCDNKIEVIPEKHRCNAAIECTDGSDEKNCENDVCSDGNGKMVITGPRLIVSGCLHCRCNNSVLFCRKIINVHIPGFRYSYTRKILTCDTRNCNMLTFLHEPFACLAIEFLPNPSQRLGEPKMIGDVWLYRGCKFTFTGVVYDGRCPDMPNDYCYVFNGGICCASKCKALKFIGEELRQHQGFQLCSNGFQLVSKGQSECVKNPQPFSVTTCEDKKGNKYFEGVKWNVCVGNACVHCKCSNALIECYHERAGKFCKQPHCDVSDYINVKELCPEGCEWGGKQVSKLESNGIDFNCERRLIYPGCYFRPNRIHCTGSFPGMINSSVAPSDLYFLCSSGDQVIEKDLVCNGGVDCDDMSDEALCETTYCRNLKMGDFTWKKVPILTEIKKNCSSINSTWSGVFTAKCEQLFGLSNSWTTQCLCDDAALVDDVQGKFSNINESSAGLQNFIEKLVERSGIFSNLRVVIHYLSLVVNEIQRRYSAITKDNDKDVAHLALVVSDSIRDLNTNEQLKERPFNHFCGALSATQQNKGTFDITINMRKFLTKAPKNSSSYKLRSLKFTAAGKNKVVRNLLPFLMRNIWKIKLVMFNDFPSTMNKSSKEIQDVKVDVEFLKNCSKHSGKITTRTTSPLPKLTKTQIYLELGLMIVATVAMIIAMVILYRVKVKSQRNAEKLYVHRSLMTSLILANLVYMADVFFTKRNEYRILCTALAVVQHYFHTAVFSWMLTEGIYLYFMLIKIFIVTKLTLIYSIIGWGLPLIVLGLTAAIEPSTYDMSMEHKVYQCGTKKIKVTLERNFCWLNGGFWIYNGPILGILLVNFALFIVFLNVAYGKLSQRFANNKLRKARKCVKCVAALFPLLGLVWLFGYTVHLHWILAYIFIIINSSQGIMIAIFHCLLDDKVKATLISKHKCRNRINKEGIAMQGNQNVQIEDEEDNINERNGEGNVNLPFEEEKQNADTELGETQETSSNDVLESKL